MNGRVWERLAQEWVTVLEWHDNGLATVRYPGGSMLKVGTWILCREEW